MADLKSLMPHIRRAAVANGIMILYFITPSFLSFVAILIAILAVIFDNPTESLKSLLNCSDECSTTKCVNQTYEKFKKLTVLQQLLLLVTFKLVIDFSWLFPSWVFVFIATQVFSAWGLLKQLGIVEMGQKYIDLAHKSLQKVANMIPRYEAK